MFRVLCLIACVAFCKGTAVLPVIVPAAHIAPILGPYGHGHAAIGFGHGLIGKHLGHHILKRSPHLAPVDGHVGSIEHVGAIGHEGHESHVAPVAFSHQARVDIHSSPVVVPVLPIVKAFGPIFASVHAKPHRQPHAVGYYGSGHVGHY